MRAALQLRRVRPAALALAATVLLAGCASTFQPPAAVLGGDRISQSELSEQVRIGAALASEQAVPLDSAQGKQIVRQVLAGLIEYHLALAYALQHGIAVRTGEIDTNLEQTVQQVGGQKRFDTILAQRGLTATDVRDAIARALLLQQVQNAVATKAGLRSTASGQQKLVAYQHWLAERAAAVHLQVNPRYGRFEPSTRTVVALSSTAQ
jgi:hypothetical protein